MSHVLIVEFGGGGRHELVLYLANYKLYASYMLTLRAHRRDTSYPGLF